jgi:hypothetical protein
MKNYLKDLFDINKHALVAPVLVFGLCLIIFGLLVSSNVRAAITNIASKDQSITVTGTTERSVTSSTQIRTRA